MAVYASAREIVGPDQLPDFMLVDGKEMRLATEQEVAEIETRFEGEDETLYSQTVTRKNLILRVHSCLLWTKRPIL